MVGDTQTFAALCSENINITDSLMTSSRREIVEEICVLRSENGRLRTAGRIVSEQLSLAQVENRYRDKTAEEWNQQADLLRVAVDALKRRCEETKDRSAEKAKLTQKLTVVRLDLESEQAHAAQLTMQLEKMKEKVFLKEATITALDRVRRRELLMKEKGEEEMTLAHSGTVAALEEQRERELAICRKVTKEEQTRCRALELKLEEEKTAHEKERKQLLEKIAEQTQLYATSENALKESLMVIEGQKSFLQEMTGERDTEKQRVLELEQETLNMRGEKRELIDQNREHRENVKRGFAEIHRCFTNINGGPHHKEQQRFADEETALKNQVGVAFKKGKSKLKAAEKALLNFTKNKQHHAEICTGFEELTKLLEGLQSLVMT